MPTVSANQLMTDVFNELNVYIPGETPAPADSTKFLRILNLMMGQWAQQTLTIPAEARLVFPLLTAKGSSGNPYLVGIGGDLNTTKFPNQNSVVAAGLLLNSSTPPVEIPRGVMTDQAYEANRIKDLTSTLFTSVYYNPIGIGTVGAPSFSMNFGTLYLWPVPTDLTNSLVLYVRVGLGTFADLTTVYSVPDGYDEALYLNAAVRCQRPFGRKFDEELKTDAYNAFRTIQRMNTRLSDLANDFASIGSRRPTYNIQTGDGG